ncbi:MAG: hypothetical protein V3V96_14250 [Acidiferrobacterales bacterium]
MPNINDLPVCSMRDFKKLTAERDRLRAVNAKLLEACKASIHHEDCIRQSEPYERIHNHRRLWSLYELCVAAIAAAEELDGVAVEGA